VGVVCSTNAINQPNLEILLLWMLMLRGKDETTCWVLPIYYSSKLHFSSVQISLLVNVTRGAQLCMIPKLDTSERLAETHAKFLNVVLEKAGGDQLGRSRKK
jgi:hypothetical protein